MTTPMPQEINVGVAVHRAPDGVGTVILKLATGAGEFQFRISPQLAVELGTNLGPALIQAAQAVTAPVSGLLLPPAAGAPLVVPRPSVPPTNGNGARP